MKIKMQQRAKKLYLEDFWIDRGNFTCITVYPSEHLIGAFIKNDCEHYTITMKFATPVSDDGNILMAIYSTKEQAEAELQRFDDALDIGTGEFVFAEDNNDKNDLVLTKMLDKAKSDGRMEAMTRIKEGEKRKQKKKNHPFHFGLHHIRSGRIYGNSIYQTTGNTGINRNFNRNDLCRHSDVYERVKGERVMYLLVKGKHGEAMAFSTDKIVKIGVHNIAKSSEQDEFKIIGVTTEGYVFEAEHSYSDDAEAKEDMLMLIHGIKGLELFKQPCATIGEAIGYAREYLVREKDGSGKTV